jgi:hypothetical protein
MWRTTREHDVNKNGSRSAVTHSEPSRISGARYHSVTTSLV